MNIQCEFLNENTLLSEKSITAIIKAEVRAQEGIPPVLTLSFPLVDHIYDLQGKRVRLVDEQGIIFEGNVYQVCFFRQSKIIQVKANSRKNTHGAHKSSMQSCISSSELWDERYYNGDQKKIGDLFNATLDVPYWCRITGEFHASSFFEGRQVLHISASQIIDTYVRERVHEPLTGVRIFVNAKWTQKISTICDLTKSIQAEIPDGVIKTLTPESLQKGLDKLSHTLKASGYYVIQADADIVNTEDFLQDIVYKSSDMKSAKILPIPVYHVSPQIILGIEATIHREEVFQCYLPHLTQEKTNQGIDKTLNLTCKISDAYELPHQWQQYAHYCMGDYVISQNNIYCCLHPHIASTEFDRAHIFWQLVEHEKYFDTQRKRSAFFTQDEGKRAIRHALALARGYLAFSARCEKTIFKTTLSSARNITCDTTVILEDLVLGKSPRRGKVTAYTISLDPQEHKAFVTIEIMSSVGMGPQQIPDIVSTYGFEDSDYEDVGKFNIQNISQIQFCELDPEHDDFTKISRILTDVQVVNPAEQQIQNLRKQKGIFVNNPYTHLANQETQLHLNLKNIPREFSITKILQAQALVPWSAPSRIIRSEEI